MGKVRVFTKPPTVDLAGEPDIPFRITMRGVDGVEAISYCTYHAALGSYEALGRALTEYQSQRTVLPFKREAG